MITFKNLGKYGQLGNQLFQIASTIGIAHLNKQDFIFPKWKYSKYFEHPIPQTENTMEDYQVFTEAIKQQFHHLPLVLKGNWSLHGFFQSVKYFKPVELLIRYYFEPKVSLKNNLLDKYKDVLPNSCSIHVRKETKLDSVTRDSFWVPLQYYKEAIEFMDDSTKFLVFSNNIKWCEEHFKGSKFVFVKNQLDIEDIFLMSFCEHNIIGNSTFSWWSAWLNENPFKKVVAPDPWLGWSRGDLDMGSLVLDEWKKLDIENMVFTPLQRVVNNLMKTNMPMLPRFARFVLRRDLKKRMATGFR